LKPEKTDYVFLNTAYFVSCHVSYVPTFFVPVFLSSFEASVVSVRCNFWSDEHLNIQGLRSVLLEVGGRSEDIIM